MQVLKCETPQGIFKVVSINYDIVDSSSTLETLCNTNSEPGIFNMVIENDDYGRCGEELKNVRLFIEEV